MKFYFIERDKMTFKERVLYNTSNYEVGNHWRFQHQANIYSELKMDYPTFLKNMFVLCNEGYFESILDGNVCHFKILKK